MAVPILAYPKVLGWLVDAERNWQQDHGSAGVVDAALTFHLKSHACLTGEIISVSFFSL